MDLKAKFEQLKTHGNAVANELNLLQQRAQVLQQELVGTQAQIALLVEMDPTLKGEQSAPADAATEGAPNA